MCLQVISLEACDSIYGLFIVWGGHTKWPKRHSIMWKWGNIAIVTARTSYTGLTWGSTAYLNLMDFSEICVKDSFTNQKHLKRRKFLAHLAAYLAHMKQWNIWWNIRKVLWIKPYFRLYKNVLIEYDIYMQHDLIKI